MRGMGEAGRLMMMGRQGRRGMSVAAGGRRTAANTMKGAVGSVHVAHNDWRRSASITPKCGRIETGKVVKSASDD